MDKKYYEILGVSEDATQDDIKKAYRKLAMNHHPDRNPGDLNAIESFKKIQEAYEVLGDPNKRVNYDRFGKADSSSFFNSTPFEEFFDSFFQFSSKGKSSKVSDIQIILELEFMEAALGCNKNLSFLRNETCNSCKGTGAKDENSLKMCKLCDGHGRIVQGHSFIRIQQTCPQCQGKGKVIIANCNDCKGNGWVSEKIEIEIKVPEGAFSGMTMKIKDQGEEVSKGVRGDLYVKLKIKKHKFFSRREEDLLCVIPISYTQAVMGDKIEIPWLTGKCKLEIPAGTQNGDVLKVDGKGFVDVYYPKKRGDYLTKIEIEVPKEINEEHKEILEKLAILEKQNLTPKRKDFY